MDWKANAQHRAEALGRLIAMDAPELLIGNQWVMLWQSMTKAYGAELFTEAQERIARIKDDVNNTN